MIEIKTEIIINANSHKLWSMLTNFANYPNWNPFIINISGEQAVGSRLSVMIKPPANKPMTFKPKLLKFEQDKELRWLGTFGTALLFSGEHYFILEAIDENTTRLIHGEIFKGLLAKPMLAKIKDSTEAGFMSMNQALQDILAPL